MMNNIFSFFFYNTRVKERNRDLIDNLKEIVKELSLGHKL